MKLKIPAVDGKITDEEIAKIIAEKTVTVKKDKRGEVRETTVKDWIVRGDCVIVEVEKFTKKLTEEEQKVVEKYKI